MVEKITLVYVDVPHEEHYGFFKNLIEEIRENPEKDLDSYF